MQDKTACGFADAPAAYAKDLKDGQSLLRTIIGSFVRRHLMPLSPKDRQFAPEEFRPSPGMVTLHQQTQDRRGRGCQASSG